VTSKESRPTRDFAVVQITIFAHHNARQLQRTLNAGRREDQSDLTLNAVLSRAILIGLKSVSADDFS
jgi:hypothetical protein